MIVRIPNVYDLFKATDLFTNNEEDKDRLFSEWLHALKKKERFFLVAFDRKKAQAIFIAEELAPGYDPLSQRTNYMIDVFKGSLVAKKAILKKIKKDTPTLDRIGTRHIAPEVVSDFEAMGFKIVGYNLELKGSDNK